MSKVKIKSTLEKNNNILFSINKEAIKNDNNIVFYDDDKNLMNIFISGNDVVIKRENNDMLIELFFKDNKMMNGKYNIKKVNSYIEVKTKTHNMTKNKKSIIIEYDLYIEDEYDDSYVYKLEWSDLIWT